MPMVALDKSDLCLWENEKIHKESGCEFPSNFNNYVN